MISEICTLNISKSYTCLVRIQSYISLFYNTEIVPSELMCERCANSLTRKQQRFAYNKYLGRELKFQLFGLLLVEGFLTNLILQAISL